MRSSTSQNVPTPGKYRHIAACFLPHAPFVLLALGALYGSLWLLLPGVFLLIVIPLLDQVTGWQSNAEFHNGDFSSVDRFLLHWNTRVYVILYITAVLWFAARSTQFALAELAPVLLALSIMGGVAFAASHELLHRRRDRLDQVLQRITTTFLFYPHYRMIHVRSHHPLVATSDDKNTAWMDESIYAYLLRTVPQSMKQCWELEVARVNKCGGSGWLPILQNQMVRFALGQIALVAAMSLFAGLYGLLFYFIQVIGAHVVLESVNYIQHYGLMRRQAHGRYERTGAEHSWDTYHYFSSYASFRVGHHSSHHVSLKPYYLLTTEADALKLPVGYFWAIAMVLTPPWWRRVINPRLSPETSAAAPS